MPGFVLWPFHWLENEQVDYVIAWMLVNLYADGTMMISFTFFIAYIIVAANSGVGNEKLCNGNNCVVNPNY